MNLTSFLSHVDYRIQHALWCIRYPKLLHTNQFYIGRRSRLRILSKARIHFGCKVSFMRNFSGDFYGSVTIGDNVYFQHDCHISVHESVVIGNHCLFGESVSIYDANHIVRYGDDPIALRGFTTKPITIGNNVWVGAKATILPGVHIGDNAVVGANAVVTHDVAPYTVVGGVPARTLYEIKPVEAL